MLDFVRAGYFKKVLIERILGWPVTVCDPRRHLFANLLKNLLNNLHSFTFRGPVEFSGGSLQAATLEANKPPQDPLGIRSTSAGAFTPTSRVRGERRKAVQAYGGEYNVLLEQMDSINHQLGALEFDTSTKN